jgi:glycosyltransferase involved in cell wall biosynthesis
MRVAFVVVRRETWTGGYNYLLNLMQALDRYQRDRITPVAFAGLDLDEDELEPFRCIGSSELVCAAPFSTARKNRALLNALLFGRDPAIHDLFNRQRIDVIFEVGRFFGWRLQQAVIGWIPDLQHRLLPHLYSGIEYWKRDVGFRTQIRSGRSIMVSSADAAMHCEQYYPASRGGTRVVRFAVPARAANGLADCARIARDYGLPEIFYFLPNQYWKHKNHECVIRALSMAKTQGHEIVVAASGSPLDLRGADYFRSLQRLVSDLDLGRNFRFLGMVPGEHVNALMYACAALINPSTCEGWSTTVEEAKSAGTPLILSELAVHREQAGNRAVFFDAERPETLAAVLTGYVPASSQTRIAAAKLAAINSDALVQAFAADFADLVKEANERRRQGAGDPPGSP